MSEVNEATQNPEELVRRVGFTIRSSNVIPTPIDPTLSIEGEAADAKATGDAIAGVLSGATVNGKQAVNKAFTVYAGDILMSDAQGAQNVAEAITAATSTTAANVIYDTQNLTTVKDALDDIYLQIDSELTEEQIDEIFDSVFGGDE